MHVLKSTLWRDDVRAETRPLDDALERASNALLAEQRPDGHLIFELEAAWRSVVFSPSRIKNPAVYLLGKHGVIAGGAPRPPAVPLLRCGR